MLEHYSSTEVGASLAASIIHSLAEQAPAPGISCSRPSSMLPKQAGQLPPLQQGKVLGCKLPGGQVFAFAGCPAAVAKPSLAPPTGGRSLISKPMTAAAAAGCSEQDNAEADGAAKGASQQAVGVINICLDGNDMIHHVAYLGPQAPTAAKLAGLVGLPFSYLSAALGVPARQAKLADVAQTSTLSDSSNAAGGASAEFAGANSGLLFKESNVSMRGVAGASSGAEPGVYVLEKDIMAELSNPWAQLLFHDEMSKLRCQLLQQCSQLVKEDTAASDVDGSGAAADRAVTKRVHELTVQLLQKCSSELQGYGAALSVVQTGPSIVQQ